MDDHPNYIAPSEDLPSISVEDLSALTKGPPQKRLSEGFDSGWPSAALPTRQSKYESASSNGDGDSGLRSDFGRLEVSRGHSITSRAPPAAASGVVVVSGDGKKFALDAASVDPQNAPGIKMAKTSTGQRLKRSASYQKRLVQGNDTLADQPVGVAVGADGPVDETTSLSSTVLTDSLGRRRRNRKFMELVPLWVQVCTVMLVPIAFLAVYLGLTFHAARVNLTFLEENDGIIRGIMRCEKELLIERARNSDYLIEKDPNKRSTLHAVAKRERDLTDAECNKLILAAADSSYGVVRGEFHDELRTAISNIKILRFAIDTNSIDVREYRLRFLNHVSMLARGFTLLGKQSTMARRFVVLAAMRGTANRMAMCRNIGTEMAATGIVLDEEVWLEFNRYCTEDFRRYLREYRAITSGSGLAQYQRFMNNSDAQVALALIESFDGAEVGTRLNVTKDEFFDKITAALTLLDDMSYAVADEINTASVERAAFYAEAAKLFTTLVISLVGVSFVARAQRFSSAKVEFALERTQKTAMSVQAFVPRPFLKLLRVSSILNIERGDQTAVAITMLFCDIRNFTGISESMTNEQLFDWLQAHLQRMTQATETHRGFVNNFIGDAVSSIFPTAADAVKCAIRMQAVTDALCYELVAKNQDHMVRIGVGIHHAIVGVGILGNDKHHSCAIVSAEVNVAAQLEALTKEYGARIIVTAEVFDQLAPDAFEARPLGRVRLSADAKRDYTVHEVFAADMPENKEYKHATSTAWAEVLSCRECDRFAEADAALDEMAAVAAEYKVKDPALAIKRRTRLPVDQFDL